MGEASNPAKKEYWKLVRELKARFPDAAKMARKKYGAEVSRRLFIGMALSELQSTLNNEAITTEEFVEARAERILRKQPQRETMYPNPFSPVGLSKTNFVLGEEKAIEEDPEVLASQETSQAEEEIKEEADEPIEVPEEVGVEDWPSWAGDLAKRLGIETSDPDEVQKRIKNFAIIGWEKTRELQKRKATESALDVLLIKVDQLTSSIIDGFDRLAKRVEVVEELLIHKPKKPRKVSIPETEDLHSLASDYGVDQNVLEDAGEFIEQAFGLEVDED